jgi:hypothetical protein
MLPAISLVGFLAIGIMLGLLAFFQVLRRAMNYALSRPAREVLFTVLRREDKYKGEKLDGHIRVSYWRPDRRMVVSRAPLAWIKSYWHLVGGCAPGVRLVCAEFVAWPPPGSARAGG